MQRIGRWATPDPAEIHGLQGGEGLNSYHYVSGSLLQARDPLGLNPLFAHTQQNGGLRSLVNTGGLQERRISGDQRPAWLTFGQEVVRGYANGDGDGVGGAVGSTLAGFTPVWGQISDARDLGRAVQEGSVGGMLLGVVGFLPLGDIAKSGARTVRTTSSWVKTAWRTLAETGQWGGHAPVNRETAASLLRGNMEALVGATSVGSPTVNRAHHIITVELNDHAVLQAAGFDMNNAANGILLDKRYHPGSHPGYTSAIKAGLDKIGQKYDLANLTSAQRDALRNDIVDLQERAVDALQDMSPRLSARGSEFTPDQLAGQWNEKINGAAKATDSTE